MRVLLRIWAIFVVAAKRLFSQRWLTLATALGLVTAVALTTSIPLYADAIYYRVLRRQLVGARSGSRPPFVFMFRYVGAWAGAVDWAEMEAVDQFLTHSAGSILGLPQKFVVRYFETDAFKLFPQGEDIAYADARDPLMWVNFATATDLQDHIMILEGSFPSVAEFSRDSTVEVLIGEAPANQLGLQVGETYTAYVRQKIDGVGRTTGITVRIAGVWRAMDATEEYWFYDPESLEEVLIVPEETFMGRIGPYLEDEVHLGLWYLVMDGSDVRVDGVNSLLARTAYVQQRAAGYLPDTRLDASPVLALQAYRRNAAVLTLLLYAFSVPIVGLILAFIGLVVGLAVARQRNEIAVLRSRGATAVQVVGIAALEGLLLGVIALGVGLPVGELLAQLIGRSRSFLDFTLQSDLRVSITMATVRFGLVAVAVALVAQVFPTVSAARHTIVTYKQERARTLRRPWWQRACLDLLLFVPAAYGAYVLRKQGSVIHPLPLPPGRGDTPLPVSGTVLVNDPFQNPLLFLVPALGVFALTLFVLRILPALMAAIAWIASRTGNVGMLLAARHLSRSPGFYSAPLILLILTLSLSAFTASLAQTLDSHLYDQMYYRAGADMSLVELGESTEKPSTASRVGGPTTGGETSGEDQQDAGPRWLFLPVSEHLKVEGVQAAARVGRYRAVTDLSGETHSGVYLGVDYWDLAHVTFWRRDFSPDDLFALMNALAIKSNGVLVPRGFMAEHNLRVGDTFRVSVRPYGKDVDLDLEVVGGVDLFPTWYPQEDGPLFVGNLEYLFEAAGGMFPYDVWLNTDPKVDYEQVAEDARALRLGVLVWDVPPEVIAEVQQLPQRQGLFGVLSVGFLAAALLTVVGFLLYALFSFRRRFIELGVLRAIGLSAGQMTSFLAWELAFLILTGLIAGTGLGAWVSHLFIPYLQVGTQIPPYVVEIAWPAIFRIYALFGLLFAVALAGLAALLMRMKIFQAVKLGETA